jgi:hypothetical protein
VQATVFRVLNQGGGEVITDDGLVIPYAAEVLASSGLRHLRTGQRLTVVVDPGPPPRVKRMRLGTIRPPAPYGHGGQ